jgi:hypothetical protein
MGKTDQLIDVYIESGQKKVFACAVEWPGWCRSGPDEAAALEQLLSYAERYQKALGDGELEFTIPKHVSHFRIVERLDGKGTTDFGVPSMTSAADHRPVTDADLERFERLLKAFWNAFDRKVEQTAGQELRKGPRGGGRDLEKIVEHVTGADGGYVSSVGGKRPKVDGSEPREQLREARKSLLDGLRASARGDVAERGPRGGKRWSPRYFVRRVAWHVLDHLWEIEDRVK